MIRAAAGRSRTNVEMARPYSLIFSRAASIVSSRFSLVIPLPLPAYLSDTFVSMVGLRGIARVHPACLPGVRRCAPLRPDECFPVPHRHTLLRKPFSVGKVFSFVVWEDLVRSTLFRRNHSGADRISRRASVAPNLQCAQKTSGGPNVQRC